MLDETGRLIRDTARRYARERLRPNAQAWGKTGDFPPDLLLEMGRLGLFGITLPQAYGGSGGSLQSWLAAIEEIAAGDGGISTLMHVHALGAAGAIARLGDEAQKNRWLPAMISGEAIGCVCLTEPHAGSDLAAIKTRAEKVTGGWQIRGTKQFISNGARAAIAVVLAVTDQDAGSHGLSFFLVPTGSSGFVVAKVEDKLGQRTSDTAQIIFDDCFVPEGALLGKVDQALPNAMGLLSDGRISVAAQAVGLARSAYELALAYARERTAFGQPIIEHQAVAFRLADMAMQIEAARAFAYHAAKLYDASQECIKEASMAKLFAAEMAEKVCSDALQIHGGYGYMADCAVERIYRDVRVCQIYEGTNDIQRLIIARKIAQ